MNEKRKERKKEKEREKKLRKKMSKTNIYFGVTSFIIVVVKEILFDSFIDIYVIMFTNY